MPYALIKTHLPKNFYYLFFYAKNLLLFFFFNCFRPVKIIDYFKIQIFYFSICRILCSITIVDKGSVFIAKLLLESLMIYNMLLYFVFNDQIMVLIILYFWQTKKKKKPKLWFWSAL